MFTQDTGRDAGPGKRHASALLIKRGSLLMSIALALAVAVTATVARWPAHAADAPPEDAPPENAAVWNPGQVMYQSDNSGCHTIQQASLDVATDDIATKVSDGLDLHKITSDFGQNSGVKVMEINNIRKNETHIDLTIEAWLSNDACKQSGPTQPGSAPAAADATRGTHVLGTVDLTRPDQIIQVADSSWYVGAVKVAVAAAAMVAVAAFVSAVLYSTAVAGGTVVSVIATGVLAGCIARSTVDLVLTRLFTPEEVTTVKERIAVATAGCLAGAGLGALLAKASRNVAIGLRRHLTSDEAIVGQGGLAAATAAGVTMDNRLASMVDGVADGALRASK